MNQYGGKIYNYNLEYDKIRIPDVKLLTVSDDGKHQIDIKDEIPIFENNKLKVFTDIKDDKMLNIKKTFIEYYYGSYIVSIKEDVKIEYWKFDGNKNITLKKEELIEIISDVTKENMIHTYTYYNEDEDNEDEEDEDIEKLYVKKDFRSFYRAIISRRSSDGRVESKKVPQVVDNYIIYIHKSKLNLDYRKPLYDRLFIKIDNHIFYLLYTFIYNNDYQIICVKSISLDENKIITDYNILYFYISKSGGNWRFCIRYGPRFLKGNSNHGTDYNVTNLIHVKLQIFINNHINDIPKIKIDYTNWGFHENYLYFQEYSKKERQNYSMDDTIIGSLSKCEVCFDSFHNLDSFLVKLKEKGFLSDDKYVEYNEILNKRSNTKTIKEYEDELEEDINDEDGWESPEEKKNFIQKSKKMLEFYRKLHTKEYPETIEGIINSINKELKTLITILDTEQLSSKSKLDYLHNNDSKKDFPDIFTSYFRTKLEIGNKSSKYDLSEDYILYWQKIEVKGKIYKTNTALVPLEGDKINEYGMYSKYVPTGIYTCKPFEYLEQNVLIGLISNRIKTEKYINVFDVLKFYPILEDLI